MCTVAECLKFIKSSLLAIVHDEYLAENEAWLLLLFVTKKSRAQLVATFYEFITEDEFKIAKKLVVERVINRIPLQYLVGNVEFLAINLLVRPPILIPRQETEEMVAWVIEEFKELKNEPLHILDLCTGSGCIALALAHYFPKSSVVGVDINKDAIKLARENALRNGINNVSFIEASLYTGLSETYKCDLLIANPPYIAPAHFESLQPEVRLWEDAKALIADDDGMALYKEILEQAHLFINKNSSVVYTKKPSIIFEIGIDQVLIGDFFDRYNIVKHALFYDLSKKLRWVCGWV